MTTITFLRHSKTLPATEGQHDSTRTLSQEGVALAHERRAKLAYPMFDMVIHSDRMRTQQTARIVAELTPEQPTIVVPQLMTADGDTIGDAITQVYGEIGNASLGAYRASSARRQLDVLARMASMALEHHIFDRLDRPWSVLVVGHAVMTSAICDVMTGGEFRSIINEDTLGECEGYTATRLSQVEGWTEFKLVK